MWVRDDGEVLPVCGNMKQAVAPFHTIGGSFPVRGTHGVLASNPATMGLNGPSFAILS